MALMAEIIDTVRQLNPTLNLAITSTCAFGYSRHNESIGEGRATVVIDNCTNTKIYCERVYKTLYQNTLYDNGAYTNTCNQACQMIKYASPTVPRFASFTTQYYNRVGVLDKLSYRSIVNATTCGIANIAITTIDNVIVGCLPVSGSSNYNQRQPQQYKAVVLAYQGVDSNTITNGKLQNTCYRFSSQVHNEFSIPRGFSPSKNDVVVMFNDYLKFYESLLIQSRRNGKTVIDLVNNTTEDLLIIYTELAAKHWGDLGLIFEAIGGKYVVTSDHMVGLVCRVLNINYVTDDMYTTPRSSDVRNSIANTAGTEVANVYETNTSHIFDTVQQYHFTLQ
jgi:hypothetical protein